MPPREPAPPGQATPTDWIIVVPFRSAAAKSRFGPQDNSALALAMALDTVEVALGVARVVVVTDAADLFGTSGATVHRDPGRGLNAAIAAGLSEAGLEQRRAVLLADHPALTVAELTSALAAATHPLGLVVDAAGSGSAMTTALAGEPFVPRFGPGSREAHAAAGHVELEGDWPGLRHDVDTGADLWGLDRVGPRTTTWLVENSGQGRAAEGCARLGVAHP